MINIKDSERYDILEQEWEPTTNMNVARAACGVTEWKQKNKKDWGSIEFYDERDSSNKWQIGEEIAQILNFDDKVYNNTQFQQILCFSV